MACSQLRALEFAELWGLGAGTDLLAALSASGLRLLGVLGGSA